ncbi:hypothetical protein AB6A40_004839 [Gnathostoma spinigerum]|uniref:DNA-directed RNA polymerase RpoA/D/Rpb3-type domain-containing protein n=1 Tax=Gnathostoma spinigerum TaxID=75299 RepID=A0ABD6EEV1_9BILA
MSLSKAKKSKSRKLEEEVPQDEPSGSFLFMEAERVLNTYDTNSDKPMLEEHWAVEEYAKKIEIEMINESEDGMTLEFDLVHTEAPIANAIRRILIAEVPTMAIERVYLYQNTSVIQDEVLCHRLGLLPIKADPRLFDWPLKKVVGVNEEGTDCDEEPTGDPKRELIFRLNIKCTRNQGIGKLVTNPKLLYENSFVYTNSFEWVPIENQSDTIRPPPAMVHDDILIAKLRPGQEIEAR